MFSQATATRVTSTARRAIAQLRMVPKFGTMPKRLLILLFRVLLSCTLLLEMLLSRVMAHQVEGIAIKQRRDRDRATRGTSLVSEH